MADQEPKDLGGGIVSPGPWRWDKSVGLVDAAGACLLPVYIGDIDYEARAKPADARLIAAAPEMAALLREEPKLRCDHRDAPKCPDTTKGFPPCWRHRLDALLARIDDKVTT